MCAYHTLCCCCCCCRKESRTHHVIKAYIKYFVKWNRESESRLSIYTQPQPPWTLRKWRFFYCTINVCFLSFCANSTSLFSSVCSCSPTLSTYVAIIPKIIVVCVLGWWIHYRTLCQCHIMRKRTRIISEHSRLFSASCEWRMKNLPCTVKRTYGANLNHWLRSRFDSAVYVFCCYSPAYVHWSTHVSCVKWENCTTAWPEVNGSRTQGTITNMLTSIRDHSIIFSVIRNYGKRCIPEGFPTNQ